jgi:hypothetical protein
VQSQCNRSCHYMLPCTFFGPAFSERNSLKRLADPTRFERATFAFGVDLRWSPAATVGHISSKICSGEGFERSTPKRPCLFYPVHIRILDKYQTRIFR